MTTQKLPLPVACGLAIAAAITCIAAAPITSGKSHFQATTQAAEMSRAYQKWLNYDVAYLITPEEKAAFSQLTSDDERDKFIEQFWEKRNPNPKVAFNSFRDEHYRRLAYANQKFTTGDIPGWKTDRGRTYILWGAPSKMVSFEGKKGKNPVLPYEDWVYNCLGSLGQNVVIKFVDECSCGEFSLASDSKMKDQLFQGPPIGKVVDCGNVTQ